VADKSLIEKAFERARSLLASRRSAYVRTFKNPVGGVVLKDLAKFCRAHESTGHADPTVAARLDGRREVWLRIQHNLQLSDAELWSIYGKKTPTE